MSDTASWPADRLLPGWALFAGVNMILMFLLPGAETVPFHFVWISTTLVYGLRPWPLPQTWAILGVVCVVTGAALVWHVSHDVIGWEETTEVPLMATVFLAMVWHVRRRAAAVSEARRLASSEHRMRDEQKRFVRLASHELRTPVTVARGYVELIRAEHPTPEVADDAAVVLDELGKLEQIAGRLLTLAEINESSELLLQPVDVDALLHRCVTRWQPAACRDWVLEAAGGYVLADRRRLETALDSVVDNAVRHTDELGQIRLSARRRDGAVLITVQDNGIGIPTDELGFVFEGFRSAGDRAGTGMGLAIVKAIIEAHHGTVHAASPGGRGALFTMRLPLDGFGPRPERHD